MSTKKYSTEFKKTIVNLYRSGKSYSQIHTEYGISTSALSNWIKMYSEVKIDDDTIITAQQIKELQKRNAQLEEENLILKKAIGHPIKFCVKILPTKQLRGLSVKPTGGFPPNCLTPENGRGMRAAGVNATAVFGNFTMGGNPLTLSLCR